VSAKGNSDNDYFDKAIHRVTQMHLNSLYTLSLWPWMPFQGHSRPRKQRRTILNSHSLTIQREYSLCWSS